MKPASREGRKGRHAIPLRTSRPLRDEVATPFSHAQAVVPVEPIMMRLLTKIALVGAIVFTIGAPVQASAQNLEDLAKLIDRRQDKKNEWRNIAIGAGALSILGLLKKDNTLFFLGAAGALYSLDRYEKDRKSQSRLQRTRAAYFSKPYFYRDGKRYTRKTVRKNGKAYYQFVRA